MEKADKQGLFSLPRSKPFYKSLALARGIAPANQALTIVKLSLQADLRAL
jgi:hypothetical protein